MQKYSAALIFSLLSFYANDAQAGAYVGNGGNVVVCDHIFEGREFQTTEILDFYEYREHLDLKPDRDTHIISSYREIVSAIITRIRRFDPKRADLYQELFERIDIPETYLSSDYVLYDVKDAGHLVLQQSCVLKQIAIQYHDDWQNDREFVINKKYFDQLTEFSKAGLIMHEIVYWDAVERGHLNSIPARGFVRFLFSKQFTEIFDAAQFQLYLLKSKLLGHSLFESDIVAGQKVRTQYWYREGQRGLAEAVANCALLDVMAEVVVAWTPQLLWKILDSKIGLEIMRPTTVSMWADLSRMPLAKRTSHQTFGFVHFNSNLAAALQMHATDVLSDAFVQRQMTIVPDNLKIDHLVGSYLCKARIPAALDPFAGVDL